MFKSRPSHFTLGKEPCNPLTRRLDGPLSWSEQVKKWGRFNPLIMYTQWTKIHQPEIF